MVLVVFNQNANDLGNCGRERQEVWPSTRSAHPVVRASHLLNLHKNKVSLLAGAMIMPTWGFECCRAAATKGGAQHHLAGSPGKVWALERRLETLGAGVEAAGRGSFWDRNRNGCAGGPSGRAGRRARSPHERGTSR
jgi:hypothetical protein